MLWETTLDYIPGRAIKSRLTMPSVVRKSSICFCEDLHRTRLKLYHGGYKPGAFAARRQWERLNSALPTKASLRSTPAPHTNCLAARVAKPLARAAIMTGRCCFTQLQARALGILVEGVHVGCSARPRLVASKSRVPCPSNLRSIGIPTTNCSIRSFASVRTKGPSKQSLSAVSQTEDQVLAEELGKASSVIQTAEVPEENAVQSSLKICENLARSLAEPSERSRAPSRPEKSPTSNLLHLEEESRKSVKQPPQQILRATSMRSAVADKLSMTAYRIMVDPKVFITPMLLSTYVMTQCILGRPESFPEVFDLYASKAMPQPGTSPVKYENANPKSLSSAVPLILAHSALTAAIEIKDLPLCLSIIDTTVTAPAYKRNKLFRKALFPATGLALAPAAAYVLASQLAQLQHSMDNQTATQMLCVGIVAYVGFTAMIGFVAVTTSNDQMDRITWQKGTPLTERWLREDERALVDRVAGAWGFQAISMRGEEDSVEWEALREWAGSRGLVLDSPELMEGME